MPISLQSELPHLHIILSQGSDNSQSGLQKATRIFIDARNLYVDGGCRVSYERDMKIINAATFTIQREDHTVGNVIRM